MLHTLHTSLTVRSHQKASKINSIVLIAPFRQMQILPFGSRTNGAFVTSLACLSTRSSQSAVHGISSSASIRSKTLRNCDWKASIICVWNFHAFKLFFINIKSNLFFEGKSLFQAISGAIHQHEPRWTKGKKRLFVLPWQLSFWTAPTAQNCDTQTDSGGNNWNKNKV